MAKAFRLFPTEKASVTKSSDIVARLTEAIQKNIAECLIVRKNKVTGAEIVKVQGSDGSVIFPTTAEAIKFITFVTAEPILRAYYGKDPDDAKKATPFVPDDRDELLSHSGVSTPLHDGTQADDTDPFGNQKPRTLMSRHVESMKRRGRVNNVARQARIQ